MSVKTGKDQNDRHGIRVLAGRRFRPCTTDSRHELPIAPNFLKQDFSAARPDMVWLAEAARFGIHDVPARRRMARATTQDPGGRSRVSSHRQRNRRHAILKNRPVNLNTSLERVLIFTSASRSRRLATGQDKGSGMTAAVGVLIIDESEALDPSLRAALEHEPALHTVGEGDLDDARERLVALVVLPEGGIDGTVARIASLKKRQTELKILLAFQALGGDALRALLAAGADAVVARQASPREVCAALLGLSQATPCAGTDLSHGRSLDVAEGLTPREAEILRFLSAGFSNKEVARRLSLSVRTVETHRLNLRRKTQTGRLKDLVALARKLGLAPVVDSEASRRTNADPLPNGQRPTLEAAAHY